MSRRNRTQLLLVLVAALAGAAAAAPVCGDCDGDGFLSITDALRVARFSFRHASPTPAQFDACDADGSGALSVLDALLIAQRAAGLTPPLSCRAPRNWVLVSQPDLDPRLGSLMAYDSVRGRTLLYAGFSLFYPHDTWSWDGSEWSQIDEGSLETPESYGANMVFDEARGVLLLVDNGSVLGPLAFRTWEFSSGWRELVPASSPPPRGGHVLAYDRDRQVAVLHGGYSETDTWEWDGVSWMEVVTASAPPAGSAEALVYDPVRRRMVLSAGAAQVWEYDGVDWTFVPAAGPTSLRDRYSMVFDTGLGECLLVGAQFGDTASELWTWNGARWNRLAPATSTPPLSDHALAYDTARGRAVLAGGEVLGLNEPSPGTWEWDGATWMEVDGVDTPTVYDRTAAVFDPAVGEVLLFGGRTPCCNGRMWFWNGARWAYRDPTETPAQLGSPGLVHDTARNLVVLFDGEYLSFPPSWAARLWEWNGATWTDVYPATLPRGSLREAMVYDQARSQIVLLYFNSQLSRNETWVYEGDWRQLFPAASPGAIGFHAMVYDPRREVGLLYGGDLGGSTETWVWDGNDWQELMPAQRPPPLWEHEMTFDEHRGTAILFGGYGLGTASNQTWEWDGASWSRLVTAVSPPPTVDHSMTYDPLRRAVVLYLGEPWYTAASWPRRQLWELR